MSDSVGTGNISSPLSTRVLSHVPHRARQVELICTPPDTASHFLLRQISRNKSDADVLVGLDAPPTYEDKEWWQRTAAVVLEANDVRYDTLAATDILVSFHKHSDVQVNSFYGEACLWFRVFVMVFVPRICKAAQVGCVRECMCTCAQSGHVCIHVIMCAFASCLPLSGACIDDKGTLRGKERGRGGKRKGEETGQGRRETEGEGRGRGRASVLGLPVRACECLCVCVIACDRMCVAQAFRMVWPAPAWSTVSPQKVYCQGILPCRHTTSVGANSATETPFCS